MQSVSRLPRLTELRVAMYTPCKVRIPFGLFGNLSKLSFKCGSSRYITSILSEIATAIANSPQLRSLEMIYYCSKDVTPILNGLFAKLSTENPLRLERLCIRNMDTAVDQMTLPHLTQLTSFHFRHDDASIVRSVWNSFLVHNVKLTDVEIECTLTEEMVMYLSSFSGLKRLVLIEVESNLKGLGDVFFAEVLPKHVTSLQTLEIAAYDVCGLVKYSISFVLRSP
jgi:hypothetical protein